MIACYTIHPALRQTGAAEYVASTDNEAHLNAFSANLGYVSCQASNDWRIDAILLSAK
jgi:hypothetical protein